MSRKRSKRYFGMTVLQLVILSCLGLAACGTLGGGFWFVSSTVGGGLLPAAQPVQPSATLQPLPTLFLSPTPTLTPTITPFPYEALVPQDWIQHTTDQIEIWLPSEFDATDIEQQRAESIEFYTELGYENIARQMEENPADYAFWFELSRPSVTLFVTNITVEMVPLTDPSLDEYLDRVEFEDLPAEYRVVDREDFQVGDLEVKRSIMEGNFNSIYVGIAQYAITDGTNIWLINCASHFNDFYTWLPIFDQIAQTFRLRD